MRLIKPIYKILTPKETGEFLMQWRSCLQQLSDIVACTSLKPFRVNIFVKSFNQGNFLALQSVIGMSITEKFGKECPPFGVVMQEPENPFHVIAEVGFVDKNQASVTYGNFNEKTYCIVDCKNYKEFWTVGMQSLHPGSNISALSNETFSNLIDLYNHLGLSFNNIVRQWNYIGEIIKIDNVDERKSQHYQIFNKTRSLFYKEYRNRPDFPAATGIGMLYSGVCIDSLAVSGDGNMKIIPISNPHQTESYKYGHKSLIVDNDCDLSQSHPPQFERAILMVLNNSARLFISGTASIIGEETVQIGDVEGQTRVTIKNIQVLSDPAILKSKCPELVNYPKTYSYVRVYVKYRDDVPKVRKICFEVFGDVPTTYIVADICRNNLLVEIETELIS